MAFEDRRGPGHSAFFEGGAEGRGGRCAHHEETTTNRRSSSSKSNAWLAAELPKRIDKVEMQSGSRSPPGSSGCSPQWTSQKTHPYSSLHINVYAFYLAINFFFFMNAVFLYTLFCVSLFTLKLSAMSFRPKFISSWKRQNRMSP